MQNKRPIAINVWTIGAKSSCKRNGGSVQQISIYEYLFFFVPEHKFLILCALYEYVNVYFFMEFNTFYVNVDSNLKNYRRGKWINKSVSKH